VTRDGKESSTPIGHPPRRGSEERSPLWHGHARCEGSNSLGRSMTTESGRKVTKKAAAMMIHWR
jgi:hypothetical protein